MAQASGTAPAGTWRTCQSCGRAVPISDPVCPTCGATALVDTGAIGTLPPRPRRRLRTMQVLRIGIVLTVALAIAVSIVPAVLTGPPTLPDPLTTSGWYVIAPGNFTYLAGAITGEDYIDGNYTILSPVGTQLVFQVYNESGFVAFVHHLPATPIWNQTGGDKGAIVFAAPYTDTFYLVFENPYLPTSGIVETVYVVTNYQTNVVIG